MTARFATVVALLALLASAPTRADTCSAPGLTVVEDPAGDQLGAPATSFGDIQSLAIAEPALGGRNVLVFTFKMADLAVTPPDALWAVRFFTDESPGGSDEEWFVAMLTSPDAATHFVYGSAGPAEGVASAPLLFNILGTLEPESAYAADGTITLVLDRSKVGGLDVGQFLFTMVPITHRITPTDGTQPFTYGFRSVSGNVIATDDTLAPEDYEIVGAAACGGGKSGEGLVAGAGGWAPVLLALLLPLALRRRRAV